MEKIDTPDSSNNVIEKSSSGFGHIAVLYVKRFPLGFLLSFFLTLLQISLDKNLSFRFPVRRSCMYAYAWSLRTIKFVRFK